MSFTVGRSRSVILRKKCLAELISSKLSSDLKIGLSAAVQSPSRIIKKKDIIRGAKAKVKYDAWEEGEQEVSRLPFPASRPV